MTVKELQKRMTSSEFGEWLVYDQISPGEPERSDIRHALVTTVIANANRGKRKPFQISDFLLRFKGKEPVKKTAQEIKIKLKSWLSAFNEGKKDA